MVILNSYPTGTQTGTPFALAKLCHTTPHLLGRVHLLPYQMIDHYRVFRGTHPSGWRVGTSYNPYHPHRSKFRKLPTLPPVPF